MKNYDAAFDLELQRARHECVRILGWNDREWNASQQQSILVLKCCGFDNPADVRRVANRYGKHLSA